MGHEKIVRGSLTKYWTSSLHPLHIYSISLKTDEMRKCFNPGRVYPYINGAMRGFIAWIASNRSSLLTPFKSWVFHLYVLKV